MRKLPYNSNDMWFLDPEINMNKEMCPNKKHTSSSHVCGMPGCVVQVDKEYRDRLLCVGWEATIPSHKTQSALQRKGSWDRPRDPGLLWGKSSTLEDRVKEHTTASR